MFKRGCVLFAVLMFVAGLCGMVGCDQVKVVTTGYEITGRGLPMLSRVVKSMCDSGQLEGDSCGKIQACLAKTSDAYLKAGDLYVDVLQSSSKVIRITGINDHIRLMAEVVTGVGDLVALIKAAGIDLDEIKEPLLILQTVAAVSPEIADVFAKDDIPLELRAAHIEKVRKAQDLFRQSRIDWL